MLLIRTTTEDDIAFVEDSNQFRFNLVTALTNDDATYEDTTSQTNSSSQGSSY